jgi:hypothetical protein
MDGVMDEEQNMCGNVKEDESMQFGGYGVLYHHHHRLLRCLRLLILLACRVCLLCRPLNKFLIFSPQLYSSMKFTWINNPGKGEAIVCFSFWFFEEIGLFLQELVVMSVCRG